MVILGYTARYRIFCQLLNEFCIGMIPDWSCESCSHVEHSSFHRKPLLNLCRPAKALLEDASRLQLPEVQSFQEARHHLGPLVNNKICFLIFQKRMEALDNTEIFDSSLVDNEMRSSTDHQLE